ncbi:HPP family protein [Bailinhaonella thermotolerans]|uniref:HPP family protein n=2 Tax=Bailinhaonella thermotolerans TaxID=1070861 RepID=A0A3A4AWD0_9ACTN|nr:HPP family protein [Bailinhaonella thermotolerans]
MEKRHSPRLVHAVYCGLNSFIALALMALIAWATHKPFLFPSLGPTAFLLFFSPLTAASSPRNTLCGHLVGVLAGWLGLTLTGLQDDPPDLEHVTGPRILAAAIALGLTCGLMPLLRAAHPPAGATTLIVALGLLRTPADLAVMMFAVAIITLQGVLINRLAGVRYPLWSAPPGAPAR